MSDKETLIDEAELGEEARNFLASKLGEKIRELAAIQYEEALKGLAVVDPNDTKQIQKLQNQVQLYGSFDQWLREIVFRGENAIEIFRHQEQKE